MLGCILTQDILKNYRIYYNTIALASSCIRLHFLAFVIFNKLFMLAVLLAGLRSRPKYEAAPAPAPEHIPIKM